MPFQSKSQAKFLYAKHPDIAKRWSAEGYGWKGLPEHKKQPKKSSPEGLAKYYSRETRSDK